MDKTITESKKGKGLLYGIVAVMVSGAGAAFLPPAIATGILAIVTGSIVTMVVNHGIQQGKQDVAQAKAGTNATVNVVSAVESKVEGVKTDGNP